MTDQNLPKVHLIFDLERGRLDARSFLKELAEQKKYKLEVTGVSKRYDLAPRHKEHVVIEEMKQARYGLVLVSPMAALSRNVIEEVKFAKHANLRVMGVLMNGSTAHTHLPEGLHRHQVVGWDWAALLKMMD